MVGGRERATEPEVGRRASKGACGIGKISFELKLCTGMFIELENKVFVVCVIGRVEDCFLGYYILFGIRNLYLGENFELLDI